MTSTGGAGLWSLLHFAMRHVLRGGGRQLPGRRGEGEATPAVSVDTSECNAYKTDAAKKYCQKQASEARWRPKPNPSPIPNPKPPRPNPKPRHQPEAGEGVAAGRR